MSILMQGVMLGLSISLLMGPLIFLFVDAASVHGKSGALMIGLGAWISDLLYLFLAYFAYKSIVELVNLGGFETKLGLVGGCILLILGIFTFLNAGKSSMLKTKSYLSGKTSNLAYGLKGFIVNAMNPFCILIWLSAVSSIMIQGDIPFQSYLLFVAGIISVIVFTDLIKILAANKMIDYLSASRLKIVRRIAGLGIFIFGLVLIIRVI